MIGHDHLAGTTEPLRTLDIVGQHAGSGHEPDKKPEHTTDGLSCPLPMGLGITGQTAQQRENNHSQAQPAQPEQGEAGGGRQQAPVVGVTFFFGHRLRCQVHRRFFQACWQEASWPSKVRNRLRGWGHWDFDNESRVLFRDSCQSFPGVISRPTA
ncbi:hypothetical protein D3C84_628220 [compost metagenome]